MSDDRKTVAVNHAKLDDYYICLESDLLKVLEKNEASWGALESVEKLTVCITVMTSFFTTVMGLRLRAVYPSDTNDLLAYVCKKIQTTIDKRGYLFPMDKLLQFTLNKEFTASPNAS